VTAPHNNSPLEVLCNRPTTPPHITRPFMALITVVLPRQRPRAMRRTGLDGPRGLPRRRSPRQPLSGCRGELPPVTRQHAPTPAAAAPAVRPAARRPLSSAAAANPLRVPRRVPPSLSCTHRHQAAAAPAVRPAARRPLSSAAAATPLRVPRRVPPPLSCTHRHQAAAAPAVRPAARRPLSSVAASTPRRVPRRVPASMGAAPTGPLTVCSLAAPLFLYRCEAGRPQPGV
jgi:hypothetical protein